MNIISYIFMGLVSGCVAPGIQTDIYSKIASQCVRTGSCLKLYQTESQRGVTWKESQEFCADNGMTLAGIPEPSMQERVEDLVKNDIYKRGAWLAGRRDYNDLQWSSLDGNPINILVIKVADAGDCAVLVSDINTPTTFQTTRCDDATSGHNPVCQYGPNTKGSCTYCLSCDKAISYEGACYINVTEPRGNWFDAQNVCRERYGGQLAYARYVIQILLQLSTETPTGQWTGIHRRPWQWTSGTRMDNEPVRMQYFNWVQNFTDDGFTKNCVKLSEDGTSWNVEDCSARLNQFICLQDISADTTQLPVPTTSDSGLPADENTTLIIPTPTNALNVIAIAVPVVVVCVLGVIVGLVIYFRKKRKHHDDKLSNATATRGTDIANPASTNQRSFYMAQLGSGTPPQVQNDTFTAPGDTEAPLSPPYDNTAAFAPIGNQESRFLSSQTDTGYEDVSNLQTDEGRPRETEDMYLTIIEEEPGASDTNDSTANATETPQSPHEYDYISSVTEGLTSRISLGEYLTPISTNDPSTGQYEIPKTYINSDNVRPSVYESLD